MANTAFGVPLADGEHVVFAHLPPPVSTGERIGQTLIGVLFLVVVFGVFIIINAWRKVADRAWFITNQRIINVTGKGKVTAIKLENVARIRKNSSLSLLTIYGSGVQVDLPLVAKIGETHLQTVLRQPMQAAELPAIEVAA